MRQKLCQEDKDKLYDEKCKEIEMLDKAHSQLLYNYFTRIQELQPKGNRITQTIKNKQGKILLEKEEIMEDGRNMWKSCTKMKVEKKVAWVSW